MNIETLKKLNKIFDELTSEQQQAIFDAFKNLNDAEEKGKLVSINEQCNDDDQFCWECLASTHGNGDEELEIVIFGLLELTEGFCEEAPQSPRNFVGTYLSPQKAFITWMSNQEVFAVYDDSEAVVECMSEFSNESINFAVEQ